MIDNQLLEFFIYVISGIGISIFFDIFRVLRKSIKTSNLITYVEDFIFWIIVGTFLIWELFTISYGYLRSYIFIGLILGVILYLITLSKYFIKINVKILNFIKKIILKIISSLKNLASFIGKLLRPIFILIKKPIYFLCINLKKNINGIKLKTNNYKKNISSKKHLFNKKKIVKK